MGSLTGQLPYEDVETHRIMLSDSPRVRAYRSALEHHRRRISGGVVLDVGCGTGLLACLAARLGARKVFAVEPSGIAVYAQRVAERNGLDGVVQIINKRIEDVLHSEAEPVDVIVSEWMGFHLLHEGMLPSVLRGARDRFLKRGGLMLPQRARVWCAPVDMQEWADRHLHFWEDVCGLDMSALIEPAVQRALSTPLITDVNPSQLLAEPLCAKEIDLHACTPQDAQLVDRLLPFEAAREGYCHGFCVWFDVDFASVQESEPLLLSTSPSSEKTHWQQSVVLLSSVLLASPGSSLQMRLHMRPDEHQPRHCVLAVEMGDAEDDDGGGEEHGTALSEAAEREAGMRAVIDAYLAERKDE
jgi:protein arginine N-methyltransferase 1